MQLYIYNNLFQKIAVIDSWVSCIWHKKYNNGYGGIDLEVQATKDNISLYKRGYFIARSDLSTLTPTQTIKTYTQDGKSLSYYDIIKPSVNEIMIITSTQLTTDNTGKYKFVVGGEDITSVLQRRIAHGSFTCLGSENGGFIGFLQAMIFSTITDFPIDFENGNYYTQQALENYSVTSPYTFPIKALCDSNLWWTTTYNKVQLESQVFEYMPFFDGGTNPIVMTFCYQGAHDPGVPFRVGTILKNGNNYYKFISQKSGTSYCLPIQGLPYNYRRGPFDTPDAPTTQHMADNFTINYIQPSQVVGYLETSKLAVGDVIITTDGYAYIVTQIYKRQELDTTYYFIFPLQDSESSGNNYYTSNTPYLPYKTTINYNSIYDLLNNCTKEWDVGFQVYCPGELQTVMSSNSPKFKIMFYDGTDKTITGSENPVVFSSGFENLLSSDLTENDEELANYALIGGVYPTNPSDDGIRTLNEADYTTYIDTSKSGLDKRERYVDCKSEGYRLKLQGGLVEGPILRIGEYRDMLLSFGQKELDSHKVKYEWTCEIVPDSMYVYGKDYLIGDKVTIKNAFGMSVNAKITEVTETWDTEGKHIEVKLKYLDSSTGSGIIMTENSDLMTTENSDFLTIE